METDALDRLERLFRAARMHPPDERDRFLDAACPDDPVLRQEVGDLIRSTEAAEADAFLDRPATAFLGGDPSTADTPADAEMGERIGPYRTLRLLGRGGMGAVYLAVREVPFVRYVALKVVRPGLHVPEVGRRFEQERQILASLSHPNIARLLDGGVTDDGRPYFAMEYVEGQPITEYCDGNRLGLEARLRLFRTVCDAVHYAHQNLILHRDLKPSNVLVATDGAEGSPTVKLLDFGIAKVLNPTLGSADRPVTREAFRVFTPEYASPEQRRGDPLSTASDIYSLGVVLYELLAGDRPRVGPPDEAHEPERPSTYVGRTSGRGAGAPEAVARARDTAPDRLRRRLRGDLDAIALKALRGEPARRYPSAEEMGRDLDRHLCGRPVLAHRGSRAYRARKFVARHRVEVVSTVLVLLALVGGLSVALWQAGAARAERDRTARALRQSEELGGFLMSLFEARDPTEAQGDTLTAVELLLRGVRRAEALTDEPTVQARLVESIAQAQSSLGLYDDALALHERALALRRAAYGENDEVVARSLAHKAEALTRLGRYSEADHAARGALAIQQRVLGPGAAEVGTTLVQLSRLAVYLGDLEGALRLAQQALGVHTEALGPSDPLVGQTWSVVGQTLRRTGDLRGSEAAFRRALTIARQHYGNNHEDVAEALLQLAYSLDHAGRLDEAALLIRRAIEVRRLVLGEGHPMTAHAIGDLAHVLSEQGAHTDALALYDQHDELLRQSYGPDHPAVLGSRLGTVYALRRAGRLDEAEATARDVLERRRRQLGPWSPALNEYLRALGAVRGDQGADAEAERLYRDAIALAEVDAGERNPHAALLTGELATIVAKQGRYEEAEGLFQLAEVALRRVVRDEHHDVQDLLHRFGAMYDAWGRPEEADRYRSRLIGPP